MNEECATKGAIMIHILPINDIQPHEESTTCHCNPTVEFLEGEGLVTHNSFDGRELEEFSREVER